jgi:hypothetical protein
MTELRRLIDVCESDFERSILSAGRTDSSDLRKAQVLAALGVGSALTLTSGTSAAGTLTKVAQAVLAKKLLVASIVAGASFAGAVAYRSNVADDTDVAVEEVAQANSVRAARQVSQGVEVTALPIAPPAKATDSEPVDTELGDEPTDRGAVPERSSGRVHHHRGAEASPGLNEEIALLDRARSAINGGRPSEALVRLDEHAAKFPKGGLSLEAQVLRVQALAAAGRNEEASRRAKRILSRSPNSVVAKRLRQYVIE